MSSKTSIKRNNSTGTITRGWAAFSLGDNQSEQDGDVRDSYPSLPSKAAFSPFMLAQRNDKFSERSYCDLIKPSFNFPGASQRFSSPKESDDSGPNQPNDTNFKKLKELHKWADTNLIYDVVAAVNDDMVMASIILNEMKDSSVESVRKEEIVSEASEETTSAEDFLENRTDLFQASESAGKFNESDKAISKDSAKKSMNFTLSETELEENDIYLIHRKNAIKAMRAASQHSRAATNAYMRRDHFSAQQHSQKAKEQWLAAEKLNSRAARDILKINNRSNDMWKLDLHGLHKAEATQAVLLHLREIETHYASDKHIACDKTENTSSQKLFRMKPVQIITGVGNHGRGGEAILPAAVKVALFNHGYHYDEMRPGALLVWPKYRSI